MDTMVYEKKADPDVKNIKTQFLNRLTKIDVLFIIFVIRKLLIRKLQWRLYGIHRKRTRTENNS